jgi:hypothetical protein
MRDKVLSELPVLNGSDFIHIFVFLVAFFACYKSNKSNFNSLGRLIRNIWQT